MSKDTLEELEKLALLDIEDDANEEESEEENLDDKEEQEESTEEESEEEQEEESSKEEDENNEEEDDKSTESFETIELEIAGNTVQITSKEELAAFLKKSADRLSIPEKKDSNESEFITQGKLSADDLILLIDAKNGNKAAIAKIAKLGKIDLLEVENDDDEGYTPEFQPVIISDVERVAQDIVKDEAHATQFRAISSKLPTDFITAISSNASDLKTFSEHIKSGLAQEIIPVAFKNSILNGTSFSQEYVNVGIALAGAKKESKQERTLTDREKELRKKASEPKSGSQSSGGKQKLTPDDIANMSEEDFAKLKPSDLE